MAFIVYVLGAGWADDSSVSIVPQVAECYTGESCVDGGADSTNETVFISGRDRIEWGIMSKGGVYIKDDRLAFTIEEAATSDADDLPSKDD